MPQYLLDYLSRRLPWLWDVPQSETIYDHFYSQVRRLNVKDKEGYDKYVLVKCYVIVVYRLKILAEDLNQSWRVIKSLYEKGRGPQVLTKG